MYQINTLFFYHPIFMTELLLAELLFLHRLSLKKGLAWRIPLALLIGYGLSFVWPTVDNIANSIFSFLGMFAASILALRIVFACDWTTLIFCCLAGFNLQHLSYEAYDLVVIATRITATSGGFYETDKIAIFSSPWQAVAYFGTYLLLYWLFYWLFARKIKAKENISIRSSTILLLSAVGVLSDALINSIVLVFAKDAPFQIICCIDATSILVCAISMAVQFEISYRTKLSDDVAFLKIVRSKEREQFRTSKENAELVSIKVHDLKHQLRALGERQSLPPDVIEEMKSVVGIYDSFAQTGNPPLDLVLSEKALIAEKNHIPLSFIVDGEAVSFLSESDTYSLFSNILDNAIEAVLPLREDQRSISLSVRIKKNFLSISESNRYKNENMRFSDGLPVTIKKDKINHGYGLKSIRYTVNKYNGDLEINADGSIFTLSILLPIPEKKKSES